MGLESLAYLLDYSIGSLVFWNLLLAGLLNRLSSRWRRTIEYLFVLLVAVNLVYVNWVEAMFWRDLVQIRPRYYEP